MSVGTKPQLRASDPRRRRTACPYSFQLSTPTRPRATKLNPAPNDTPPLPTMAEPAPPAGPLNLLRPLLLMAFAAAYLPPTLYTLLTTGQFRTLLDPSAVRDAWFARFWGFFGPRSRDMAAPHVTPLLQHAARGVCLDIGPGAGEWLYLFQRARNPHVRKIYGIEPNREMHAALRANAARAGLDGVYEVVGCGAEELRGREGWQAETVDTIITVQCLCSIPTPQTVIAELYPLLKPGGRWLVFEHVKTKNEGSLVWYGQSE